MSTGSDYGATAIDVVVAACLVYLVYRSCRELTEPGGAAAGAG
ncbi:MAG: hypothetical protein AAFZ52_17365 [Bacteroidota bacterium]